ncbi:No apical meristem (NAM) protein [Artemisia annua]|uniref:No apical meristem (NAM) protein n=1 Tax=Artemisia annua TaxID=35608 RepID=A0A2U1M9H5_ARTAN|nr:No apical meristem (NAM) protein [Artemisia annua]
MGLSDIGAKLPPGFRFYPSDEELVCHYLYKKIANEDILKGTLVEIDLHICEPWQLPEVAKLNSSEWYFFSFRDRKYATGYRTNRATKSGYWKATGKDRTVLDPKTGTLVGMRKTLVFYKDRAPNGIKTGWIMHEFRLENPHVPPKIDKKAEDGPLNPYDVCTRISVVKDLMILEYRNLKDLKQKAKYRWIKDGDENSGFFHGIINNRINRSRINGLNILGTWVTDPQTVKTFIFNTYEEKFKEETLLGRNSQTTFSLNFLLMRF